MRADAQRNRDALLAAAREAFVGGELDIRIEEIARRAGVGVGTLYRHFETREAILQAVYRQEVDLIFGSASKLLATHPPDQALALYLHRIVDHVAKNPGLATALEVVLSSPGGGDFGDQKLLESLGMLMRAAAAEGTLRDDVTPETMLAALGSLCASHLRPGWKESTRAVIDLLIDGLRLGATRSPAATKSSKRPTKA